MVVVYLIPLEEMVDQVEVELIEEMQLEVLVTHLLRVQHKVMMEEILNHQLLEQVLLEEVVVRRGDGTTRVARIEAMHEDEVVVVLGPSAGKDQGEELPFRVLDRKMVGKILLDDWVESDVASPSSSGRSRYYTACDARVLV